MGYDHLRIQQEFSMGIFSFSRHCCTFFHLTSQELWLWMSFRMWISPILKAASTSKPPRLQRRAPVVLDPPSLRGSNQLGNGPTCKATKLKTFEILQGQWGCFLFFARLSPLNISKKTGWIIIIIIHFCLYSAHHKKVIH